MYPPRRAILNFTGDLGIQRLMHLKKVLIVPDLDKRLFSFTQFSTIHGNKITFSIHGVLLQFPTATTLTLSPPKLVSTACPIRTSKPSKVNIDVLHNRLCRRSINGLLTASYHGVWSDVVAQLDLINKCITCPIASHNMATRSKKSVTQPDKPLHTLYLDTVPNLSPKGIAANSRCTNFLFIVDHHSCFITMYLMPGNFSFDVITSLIYFIADYCTQLTPNTITHIKSDAGT